MENIKMDLQNTRWQGVYLIHVAHVREKWCALANVLMGVSLA